MEQHNFSFEKIKQLQDYFNLIQREQEGLDEDVILNKAIPEHIKKNILVHLILFYWIYYQMLLIVY